MVDDKGIAVIWNCYTCQDSGISHDSQDWPSLLCPRCGRQVEVVNVIFEKGGMTGCIDEDVEVRVHAEP